MTDLSLPRDFQPRPAPRSAGAHGHLPNPFVEIAWEYRLLIAAFFLVWRILPTLIQPFFVGGNDLELVATLSLLTVVNQILILWPILSRRFGNTEIGWLHPLVLPALMAIATELIKSPITIADPIANLGHASVEAHMLASGRSLLAAQVKVQIWTLISLSATYIAFSLVSLKTDLVIKPPKVPDFRKFLLVLLFIALVAMGILYLSGGILNHFAQLAGGRFRAIGAIGILVVPVTFLPVLFLLWYFYRPSAIRQGWFVVMFLVASVMQFVIQGSRSGLFLSLVLLFLGWIYINRSLPLIRIFLLGLGAILLLSMLGELRQSGENIRSQSAASPSSLTEAIEKNRTEVAKRQFLSGPIAIAARVPKPVDYMGGETYVGGLLFFVPRAVWPEKPRGPGPTLFAKVFSGLEDAGEYEGGGTPPSGEGEAFMNFGYLGIIVIYALFGAFLKWVAVRGHTHRDPYTVTFLVIVGSSLAAPSTTAMVPFLQNWVMLYLADKFIARRPKR